MTNEQAASELGRMCAELGFDATRLKKEQAGRWMKSLRAMDYERGRLAIDAVVEQWDKSSFPPVGFFNARARQVDYEGQPNAAAYRQDGGRKPWSQSEEAAYLIWRHERIVTFDFPVPMPDEADPDKPDAETMERRYWAYCTDAEYKRTCNALWRSSYARRAAS